MLTATRLREVLHYDPATGVWMWLQTLNPRGQKGSRAGTVREDGYRRISIDGTQYFAHRLAFLYVRGEWPVGKVDHRNLTPGDDRWSNLRAATNSQNGANAPRRHHNASGFKGVVWIARTKRWRAEITVLGKRKYLGYFDTPQAAHTAYASAAKQNFGEFARSL